MLKDSSSSLTGNDRFEGFCIDLIQELSKMLGFNYTFIVQKDGNNGNFDRKTKMWDGMIGEVLRGVSFTKIKVVILYLQLPDRRFSNN